MEGSVQVTGTTVRTDGYYHMIHRDGQHRFYASLSDSIFTPVGQFTKYQVISVQQYWAEGVGKGSPVTTWTTKMEFKTVAAATKYLADLVNTERMVHSSTIKSTSPVW